MTVYQHKKTKLWKFGQAGEYKYKTEEEAKREGMNEIIIELRNIKACLKKQKNT